MPDTDAGAVIATVRTRLADLLGTTSQYAPDGDWYLATDRVTCKVWRGYNAEVRLETTLLPTGKWRVLATTTPDDRATVEQGTRVAGPPSGRDVSTDGGDDAVVRVTDGYVPREQAFRAAREHMTDIATVEGAAQARDGRGEVDAVDTGVAVDAQPAPDPAVTPADLDAASRDPFESDREYLLALAEVLARAKRTPDAVVDDEVVAATLERWRATMSGRVVLPVTLSPDAARRHRDRLDDRLGEAITVEVPVTEKLIHDLDSQIDHIEAMREADD